MQREWSLAGYKEVMDDHAFKARTDATFTDLQRRLLSASEQHPFEADFNSGALTIEFEGPPAKFIVSPNAPVHQIWVSAHSKSFKFDWDDSAAAFVLPSTGQTLAAMIAEAIGQQLGEQVTL